jgi:hypothetical protein
MSIKDVFLNNVELSFLYRNSLKGIINKNDLAETQKAQLIEFAKNEEFKAIGTIDKLLIGNPETTFEYWEQRHGNLSDAKRVLNWLTTEQVEVKSVSIEKQKPKPQELKISFKNSEIIEKIHSELKGFFPNKEAELLKVLQGEQLSEFLLFHSNQNKFVEVFRRLKYNGYLLNKDTETMNWICATFQFVKIGLEPRSFNKNTVWGNLNKGVGEPTKKERICNIALLPYLSSQQLARNKEAEKL